MTGHKQTHNGIEFEQLLKERTAHKLFIHSNGYQTPSLSCTFRRLMRDSGLEKNAGGQHAICTLYGTLMLHWNL